MQGEKAYYFLVNLVTNSSQTWLELPALWYNFRLNNNNNNNNNNNFIYIAPFKKELQGAVQQQ